MKKGAARKSKSPAKKKGSGRKLVYRNSPVKKGSPARITDVHLSAKGRRLTKKDLIAKALKMGLAVSNVAREDEVKAKLDRAKSAELIPAGSKPFMVFEQIENQVITDEMVGACSDLAKILVYEFQDKKTGKTVAGFSKNGVQLAREWLADKKRMAFRQGNIQTVETEDVIRVIVTAELHEIVRRNNGTVETYLLTTAPGAAQEDKKKWVTVDYDEQKKPIKKLLPDQFVFQKAVTKAWRNASLALIPIPLQVMLLAKWRSKRGAVKRLVDIAPEQTTMSSGKLRYLEAMAAKHGIGHDGLKKIVDEKLKLPLNAVQESDFETIKSEIEKVPLRRSIPAEVKEGYRLLGWNDERALQHWLAFKAKYGNKAETEAIKRINAQLDKGPTGDKK